MNNAYFYRCLANSKIQVTPKVTPPILLVGFQWKMVKVLLFHFGIDGLRHDIVN
jgi:hypothetical protein